MSKGSNRSEIFPVGLQPAAGGNVGRPSCRNLVGSISGHHHEVQPAFPFGLQLAPLAKQVRPSPFRFMPVGGSGAELDRVAPLAGNASVPLRNALPKFPNSGPRVLPGLAHDKRYHRVCGPMMCPHQAARNAFLSITYWPVSIFWMAGAG